MRILPIAPDGWRFILPLTIAGLWCVWFSNPVLRGLGAVLLIGGIFSLFFFRDFVGNGPRDERLILSPGDGRILEAAEIEDPTHGRGLLIRIFLSIFDGHVQRVPVSGPVKRRVYKRGRFLDARDPRAHIENEQNTIEISTPQGTVVVTQIAGLIARRILCTVKEGDAVRQGERYGLIRFGSQVDLFIVGPAEALVTAGDRVKAGLVGVARWRS